MLLPKAKINGTQRKTCTGKSMEKNCIVTPTQKINPFVFTLSTIMIYDSDFVSHIILQ